MKRIIIIIVIMDRSSSIGNPFFFSLSLSLSLFLSLRLFFGKGEIEREFSTWRKLYALWLPTLACTRLIYFFLRSRALSPLEVASRSSLLALTVESGNIPPESTFTNVDASANFGALRTFCCGTIIGNVPFSISRTFSQPV